MTAFLDSLTGINRDQAFALLGLLEQLGNAIRPPRSKQVEPGILELRGHQVRLFYTFRPGRRIMLLDWDDQEDGRDPARGAPPAARVSARRGGDRATVGQPVRVACCPPCTLAPVGGR